jgi:hypothetical protein
VSLSSAAGASAPAPGRRRGRVGSVGLRLRTASSAAGRLLPRLPGLAASSGGSSASAWSVGRAAAPSPVGTAASSVGRRAAASWASGSPERSDVLGCELRARRPAVVGWEGDCRDLRRARDGVAGVRLVGGVLPRLPGLTASSGGSPASAWSWGSGRGTDAIRRAARCGSSAAASWAAESPERSDV